MLNSGRTLGDSRVDCATALLALRAIARDRAGRDVLVVAADAAPGAGGYAAPLRGLAAAPTSALLLQPALSGAAEGGGPAVTVLAGAALAAGAGADAGAGAGAARAVLGLAASASGAASAAPGAEAAFAAPAVYYFKAADVALLAAASSAELAALAPGGAAGADADAEAGAAAERVVPIECLLLLLLSRGRALAGVPLAHAFVVGAFDGRPHALPEGAAEAGAESPYAHRTPAQLVPGIALLAASAASARADGAASAAPPPPPPSAGAGARAGAVAGTAPGAGVIHARAYARVGLLGNPSDGYGGKTLAVTVANFCAEAWLTPAPPGAGITLIPHPIFDPLHFANLGHLSTLAGREGYSGGVRLMMAALHRLVRHCRARGVELPAQRGFTVRYHTSVPRQVGLAGSSAIITAFLRAVMRFYGFGDEASAAAVGLSRDLLPNFVLAIESEELGITAGLQDRVVQAYEGCVHMDFSDPARMASPERGGAGDYARVPVRALPPLFLAYAADPSDSGRIHAPVKQRWLAGDPDVVAGMRQIAALADKGRALAEARPYGAAAEAGAGAGAGAREREGVVGEWAALMRENFDTRRRLFGDAALGRDNIRMIEIARECGASGKFPGSGGAILGVVDAAGVEAALRPAGFPQLCADDAPAPAQAAAAAARVAAATDLLRSAYHREGFVFVRLQPHEAGAGGAGVVVDVE